MVFEYICPNHSGCRYKTYRLNTDIVHDGEKCPGCGTLLERRDFGFTQDVPPPVTTAKPSPQLESRAGLSRQTTSLKAKKLHDLSEVERLEIARSEAQ